jgi:trehalose synthase-fused probable maltokinase
VEITRFLTERQRFPHIPPFAGSLEYRRAGREPQVLALALGMVPNQGDAWVWALAEVRAFYERVLEEGSEATGLAVPGLTDSGEASPLVAQLAGTPFLARARQLGVRTGEAHLALAAAEASDATFAPEPFGAEDQRALSEGVRASAEQLAAVLREREATLADEQRGLASAFLQAAPHAAQLAQEIAARPVSAAKTRAHGDYHLGQVLNTGSDFVLIDFEGEPQRSLAWRKEKRSPLRDVAGMLRSFHYAAHSGLGDFPDQRAALEPWAELWSQAGGRAFFQGWLETVAGAPFLPTESQDVRRLLEAFLLEKALYEVGYEINNRPAWLAIPVRGVLGILGERSAGSA